MTGFPDDMALSDRLAEMPKRFGPDFEGQLLALAALSISTAAHNDADKACLVELLKPAVGKLTRLLEQHDVQADSEQQGVLWHALGVAASLLGEYSRSQRWLDVAVHAHKTALLIWQDDKVVYDWAIAQNNLGHALRLLAPFADTHAYELAILKDSILAFHRALRVFRAARAMSFVSQTSANLARAEAALADSTVAAE